MKKEKEKGTKEKMKKEKKKKGIQLPEKQLYALYREISLKRKTTGYRVNAMHNDYCTTMHQRLLHNLETDTQ